MVPKLSVIPELVALAFSDIHIHKFRNFNIDNSRLEASLAALREIIQKGIKNKVPILFSGDLFHNPKEVENETLSKTFKVFTDIKVRYNFIAISGNHDMSEKNTLKHTSPSYLDSFAHLEGFQKLDNGFRSTENLNIWGIPYMNNDKDLAKKIEEIRPKALRHKKDGKLNILLLHSDAPGAKTPEGIQINETEHIPLGMDKFFKEWDLVLFGHIHLPQKLSKRCYMLGSPIHQNMGDAGNEMGYWEIYSDGSMIFKHLKDYPKFIKLKAGEKAADTFNYYVEHEQVLEDESIEIGEFNVMHSRKKLALTYCKKKSILNKAQKRALIQILNEAE